MQTRFIPYNKCQTQNTESLERHEKPTLSPFVGDLKKPKRQFDKGITRARLLKNFIFQRLNIGIS